MVRGKPISEEIRGLIIEKNESGKSYGEISKELNLAKSTIVNIVKNYKISGSISTFKNKSGRISKITARDLRALTSIVKLNRRSTVRDLSEQWSAKIGKSVGREWTRKNIHKLKYGFYKAKEKPLLTISQKKKRILWAKERRFWVRRQWDSIIFSDESKFDVCVGDSRKRVIRTKKETYHRDCLKRTVKFPASIMIWGCMSSKGVGNLHFIVGTVNAQKYIRILEDNLIPSVTRLSSHEEFIFQQDGASCHTAKVTKNWLENKGINVLSWPSSSPDLNPIESMWAVMKRRLRNEPQRTVEGLKQKITAIWNSITPEECQKLINTMPKRVEAVIKAKGDVTQY